MLHFGNNKSHSDEEEPDFMNAKLAFEKDAKRKKIIIDLFLIFCGVFCAGFGLKGFLIPSNFIDGGTMGLSLLATEVFKINLSLLIIVINAPFIILGKKNYQ